MDWDSELDFMTNEYNNRYDCIYCKDGALDCTCR